MRKHGLACDNLLSADVVTAEGKLLTASNDQNKDLFWGLRGGGGNFGIVTSFEYRLHPVSTVIGGMVLHAATNARAVLKFYREFTENAPDELTTSAAFITSPDGFHSLALIACYAGSPETGAKVVQPLREFGPPLIDRLQPMSYCTMQRLLDEAFPAGRRNYWKSSYLRTLSDEAIDVLIERASQVPSPYSAVIIERYTGMASRISQNETAFPHRLEPYNLHIFSAWTNPSEDDRNTQWTQQFWESMQEFSSGSVYVNFLGAEGDKRVQAAFGKNYERLALLKKKYDPSNLFRHNQNIRPASEEL